MARWLVQLCCLLASARADDRALLATRPFGPDVSHWQGSINWANVRTKGAGFAIAKATEGTTFTDANFKSNWAGIKAAGIKVRGAYHYGLPSSSAATQAQHFVDTVGVVSAGDFLVLDIEDADSQGASAVAAWCGSFVDAVRSRSGLPTSRVFVYTGAWFWNPQAGGSSVVGDHPLWVSGYTTSPPMPSGWSQWTMWQYTDKETAFGINSGCDSSYYQGTQAELEALVGLAPSPTPTPTPSPTVCTQGYCKANSPKNACGCCRNIESDCGHTTSGSPYYCQGSKDSRCTWLRNTTVV
jgi:GH25 family lysozyme M1 (1,4-beta-N-acetylmuramidase)